MEESGIRVKNLRWRDLPSRGLSRSFDDRFGAADIRQRRYRHRPERAGSKLVPLTICRYCRRRAPSRAV